MCDELSSQQALTPHADATGPIRVVQVFLPRTAELIGTAHSWVRAVLWLTRLLKFTCLNSLYFSDRA